MDAATFTLRPLEPRDRAWVVEMVKEWGGTDFVISRGRAIHPAGLPGFLAVAPDGARLGLVGYEPAGAECQLVLLQVLRRYEGIGTALLAAARRAAEDAGCSRLWLITTNDNLDALRFYQRRGFRLAAVHHDLREVARRLKPSLPLVGEYGIPINDEIELEMLLV